MSCKFFVVLAVCWLMIFDEQLCMNPPNGTTPTPHGDHAVELVKNNTEVLEQFRTSFQHINWRKCLPVDGYYDAGPLGTYKLHVNATKWADARKICRAEHAHLVIINSKAEATVLSTMLSGMGHVEGASMQHTAFIGIHDIFKKGEWVTVLDDPLYATGYTALYAMHFCPINTHNCGTLREDGKLYASHCDYKLPFFCKKPKPCPCPNCC